MRPCSTVIWQPAVRTYHSRRQRGVARNAVLSRESCAPITHIRSSMWYRVRSSAANDAHIVRCAGSALERKTARIQMRREKTSVSQEDYLKAIWEIVQEEQVPISARLAEDLAVTPPAVTAALKR